MGGPPVPGTGPSGGMAPTPAMIGSGGAMKRDHWPYGQPRGFLGQPLQYHPANQDGFGTHPEGLSSLLHQITEASRQQGQSYRPEDQGAVGQHSGQLTCSLYDVETPCMWNPQVVGPGVGDQGTYLDIPNTEQRPDDSCQVPQRTLENPAPAPLGYAPDAYFPSSHTPTQYFAHRFPATANFSSHTIGGSRDVILQSEVIPISRRPENGNTSPTMFLVIPSANRLPSAQTSPSGSRSSPPDNEL